MEGRTGAKSVQGERIGEAIICLDCCDDKGIRQDFKCCV